ncbi:uncharacterized protein LOC111696654 [Eurytemora carolleeae]|uniref:uncharacterized protein LOC111696654 n=1 Tax=Eurytemora carolleeae TaxID=1294199 RepID=UPI000C779F59|nr:uncharacterized protein LOC111696654 [Eurytemora carolleeae]|eukprot:XP_023322097.1 uncharacterized protein LOC111696654 [Eurytemora affinis]
MRLDILNVGHYDFSTYRCVAKNSLGESDGKLRLQRIESGETVTRLVGKSSPAPIQDFSPDSTLASYKNYPKYGDRSTPDWRQTKSRTRDQIELEAQNGHGRDSSHYIFSGSTAKYRFKETLVYLLLFHISFRKLH